jgi:hypothetical protein
MWIFLIYIIILLVGFVTQLKNPHSRRLSYFRIFFPSWRFFEAPGDRLSFAVMSESTSSWHEVSFHQPQRRFLNYFWNPFGNEKMACYNLLEHFVQDLEATKTYEDTESLISFKLLQNMAALEIQKIEKDFKKYKFKISLNDEDDLLISDWYMR